MWHKAIWKGHPMRPDFVVVNKKKTIFQQVKFTIPAECRVELKESKKQDRYLDFAQELKKLGNMKVTLIPMVVGKLGTIMKYLEKRWR